MVQGWGSKTWGTGEGQSLSVFDHLTGTNSIHSLFHGQSYENKYKEIGTQIGGVHGAAQAALHKALGAIKQGYGGADNYLSQQGALGTKAILDRETQNMGGAQQSLISRGLYDSTAFDAAGRGIHADTNNSLAQLNAQLAEIGSNIKVSEGRDIAGAYGNIAGEEDNYAQLLLSLGLNTEYGEQGGIGGLVSGILGGVFG